MKKLKRAPLKKTSFIMITLPTEHVRLSSWNPMMMSSFVCVDNLLSCKEDALLISETCVSATGVIMTGKSMLQHLPKGIPLNVRLLWREKKLEQNRCQDETDGMRLMKTTSRTEKVYPSAFSLHFDRGHPGLVYLCRLPAVYGHTGISPSS